MRAIDLETKVIIAVDQLRAGQHVEHDLIECKRNWPQEHKARQLAGSLNRAGGDPVIYIIGIDEKTGDVHDVSGTDIHDWWSQIVPQFDHTPPELVRHLNVQVGDGGEHVVAVAVASDRACPYVVKTGKGNQSFEVLMREGTGTRSARRDELLRISLPTVSLPEVIALEGQLYAEYAPKVHGSTAAEMRYNQDEGLYCTGSVRLYFAHNGREATTLPTHGMKGSLLIDGEAFKVAVRPDVPAQDKPSPAAAPIVTRDGITISGSGAARFALSLHDFPPSDKERLRTSKQLRLDLELEVIGGLKPIKISATIHKDNGEEEKNLYQEILGSWSYQHSGLS